jgi:hypothetical protein
MSNEKRDPPSVGGGVFHGSVTAGRDVAGRDIRNDAAPSVDQLKVLLAPMQALAAGNPQASEIVKQLENEAAKGKTADDGVVAKLIEGFVGLIPAGAGAVVSAFASPLLGAIAGPVTKYVLDNFKK